MLGAGHLIIRNIFRFGMSSFSGCSLPSDRPLPGELALRCGPHQSQPQDAPGFAYTAAAAAVAL